MTAATSWETTHDHGPKTTPLTEAAAPPPGADAGESDADEPVIVMPRSGPRTKDGKRLRQRAIEKRQAEVAAAAMIKALRTQNTQLQQDLHRALACRSCGCRTAAEDIRCPDCAAREFSAVAAERKDSIPYSFFAGAAKNSATDLPAQGAPVESNNGPQSPQTSSAALPGWQQVIPVLDSSSDRPLVGLQKEQAREMLAHLERHGVRITQHGREGITLCAQHEPPADLWRAVRTEGGVLFRYLRHDPTATPCP
jgi:hypothetical protein